MQTVATEYQWFPGHRGMESGVEWEASVINGQEKTWGD
jgi:hypothetical protein